MSMRLPSLPNLAAGLLLTAATSVSATATASTIDLALSSDIIEFQWQEDLGSDLSGGLTFFHADTEEHGSTQKTDYISADFLFNGTEGIVEYQMGGKIYYLTGKKVDGHGASVGGDVSVNFTKKFFADVTAFYSPDIINGGDFENLTEASTSVGFKPSDNAKLYVGYKYTSASVENIKEKYKPYQGIILGFSARF
ncbi:MAG: hypothetical protein KAG18_06270 [Sinobacterium sp.]|nr:hypothetical protein [Sinobacterium sp.]